MSTLFILCFLLHVQSVDTYSAVTHMLPRAFEGGCGRTARTTFSAERVSVCVQNYVQQLFERHGILLFLAGHSPNAFSETEVSCLSSLSLW